MERKAPGFFPLSAQLQPFFVQVLQIDFLRLSVEVHSKNELRLLGLTLPDRFISKAPHQLPESSFSFPPEQKGLPKDYIASLNQREIFGGAKCSSKRTLFPMLGQVGSQSFPLS